MNYRYSKENLMEFVVIEFFFVFIMIILYNVLFDIYSFMIGIKIVVFLF